MLTVTPAAAAAVTAILHNPDVPDGAGVRLQMGVDATGNRAIGITIVTEPEPDDERVSSTDDDDVFVDRELVDVLDRHVLDADIDGRNVAFTIRPQAVDGRPE